MKTSMLAVGSLIAANRVLRMALLIASITTMTSGCSTLSPTATPAPAASGADRPRRRLPLPRQRQWHLRPWQRQRRHHHRFCRWTTRCSLRRTTCFRALRRR